MAAMIFKGPPQWGQFNIDIEHPFEQPGPAQAGRCLRGRLGGIG